MKVKIVMFVYLLCPIFAFPHTETFSYDPIALINSSLNNQIKDGYWIQIASNFKIMHFKVPDRGFVNATYNYRQQFWISLRDNFNG